MVLKDTVGFIIKHPQTSLRVWGSTTNMVEGLDLTQFRPYAARKELEGAAVPYSEPDPPTLSHLAAECKGPGNAHKPRLHMMVLV